MADKHPYTSGPSNITQVINQLRRSFPSVVTAETLKKLGIAPNNESYILNILKFIGVLDTESKKVPEAATVFNKHDQAEFQQGFSGLIKTAYHEIFDLHGEDGWALEINKLISFFRTHDETSDIVGRRQATTFQTLARLAGKLNDETTSTTTARTIKSTTKASSAKKTQSSRIKAKEVTPISSQISANQAPVTDSVKFNGTQQESGVALTVRIEINLPAGGDQTTYDSIFKSIRENLMNGNSA